MASAVSGLSGTSASTNASSSTSSSSSSLSAPSEEMFLQLLVAQLQNQDPLNPTDSTQFVSQLAQFSELEQVIAIRSDIESYAAKSEAGASSSTDSSGADGTASNTDTGTTNGTANDATSNT
jgi:flagellar basal-body rod modification protein FlgD